MVAPHMIVCSGIHGLRTKLNSLNHQSTDLAFAIKELHVEARQTVDACSLRLIELMIRWVCGGVPCAVSEICEGEDVLVLTSLWRSPACHNLEHRGYGADSKL